MAEQRVGLGFDVHPRADGSRPLFLGGAGFEDVNGLAGHSDGDVVCHALADALLGASGLGDVGEHFPEDDPRIAGIPGLELLARTVAKVRVHGLTPVSADVTIIAERPGIAPRREEIQRHLAATLSVVLERVSVKATRPEGLGLSGDGAACIALAVVSGL
ncbi:MAG: 2-C-methyl-D-erythritol 2,4-cyclodiphosphate synthase [Actinomycetota bacterium]